MALEQLQLNMNKLHRLPDKLLAVPAPVEFEQLPTPETKIYFVNHDMKQAEIIMLSKDIPFNKDVLPQRSMFNEYYGGNMSSVVFQTMRESKALAYSVYATFTRPSKKEDAHYVFAYIGTQADKLHEAMDGFFDLLTVMFLSRYLRKPLHLFGILGIFSFLGGFVIGAYLTVLRLTGHWISNRPILFLGILLMIMGVQFISIGLLGEMIIFTHAGEIEEYNIEEIIN
jgi:hypothetical protein